MNEPANSLPSEPKPQAKQIFTESFMKNLGLILLAFFLLQVPLIMVQGVMEEREKYNVDYPQKFAGSGPKQQTIIGPILSVPYHYQVKADKVVPAGPAKGKKAEAAPTKTVKVSETQTGYLFFFPENLTLKGNLSPQTRDEGKFKSILYSTALEFKGSFNTSDFIQLKIRPQDVMWHDAVLSVGISDLRGIRKETELSWGAERYKFVPGVTGQSLFDSGQRALLTGMQGSGSYSFTFTVALNGSRDLSIFPAGKENKITLASTWPQPTFTGGFLPTEKSIGREGFHSLWEVSYFSRNLPQFWTDRDPDIKSSLAQYMVGVTLATPVEFYRTAIRAVKYGNLFIVMTFLSFLIVEIISQLRIHAIQYLLVGLALCLFFLLLIALTEWIPFSWAYVLASVPTIAQISWYIQAFSKGKSKHLWKVMAIVLVTLYAYLYVLLELENFSLLCGAIGLFIALSVVLYVTRNIDWHAHTGTS